MRIIPPKFDVSELEIDTKFNFVTESVEYQIKFRAIQKALYSGKPVALTFNGEVMTTIYPDGSSHSGDALYAVDPGNPHRLYSRKL